MARAKKTNRPAVTEQVTGSFPQLVSEAGEKYMWPPDDSVAAPVKQVMGTPPIFTNRDKSKAMNPE